MTTTKEELDVAVKYFLEVVPNALETQIIAFKIGWTYCKSTILWGEIEEGYKKSQEHET